MKNRVLVLGGNGMAGHVIALYLSEKGYEVQILCRKEFFLSELVKCIVWDETFLSLKNIINSRFDVIINCIGMLNAACNNDPLSAVKINSYLPQFIAQHIGNTTKLIHLSTDCVFSGKNAPYDEFSIPDGNCIYDVTKATGELIRGSNITVLRNSIIGPDMNSNGIGLYNWFLHQRDKIKGYDNWIWSGITTLELAKQIDSVIQNNLSGLFHLTNNKSISKYALLNLFKDTNKKVIVIENVLLPDEINKTLINTKGLFWFEIPSYEQMILEMYEWIQNHKEKYIYE